MTYFLEEAVGVKENAAALYVIVLNLTTPIFGSAIGGILFAKIGGYKSPKAHPLCILITLTTTLIAGAVPWSTNAWLVFVLFWLVQFVAIMYTPAALGIMLD